MKEKKLIRYRIPVSVKFPATHQRKGEPTWFVEKISSGQCKGDGCSVKCSECDINRYVIDHSPKLHTIRDNYPIWVKRFEKINRGEAVLELYYWSGKPYNSKAVTICQLGKDDGIGIQYLNFEEMIMCASNECFSILRSTKDGGSVSIYRPLVNDKTIIPETLARNDGLLLADFKAWFKGADLSQPFAIIHFTPFRY